MTNKDATSSADQASAAVPPLPVPPGTMTFERITYLDPALFQPVLHVSTRGMTSLTVAEPPTMDHVPVIKDGRPVEDYGFADLWVNEDGAKYARMAWNGTVQSFRVRVEPAIGMWRVDEVRFALHEELSRMLIGMWLGQLERM
ncbi:MAG: hypothetical protein ACK52V_13720 [Betaproteobacteria bacterium]|jgi:hypothetical protein